MDKFAAPIVSLLLTTFLAFCQAQELTKKVILVSPEDLGFGINPNADPFSNNSPVYLSPAKPLEVRLQEAIGVKFPAESKLFYDFDSRALSVSSTKEVIDAIAIAFKPTARPNVLVELRTYESRQSRIEASEAREPIEAHTTVISRDQFVVGSPGAGSMSLKAPETVAKSGGLVCQITPTVDDDRSAVDAEISLIDESPSSAVPVPSEKRAILKTSLLLKFNAVTSIYQHQLPSGAYFGIAVRLTLSPELQGPIQKPGASDSSKVPQR